MHLTVVARLTLLRKNSQTTITSTYYLCISTSLKTEKHFNQVNICCEKTYMLVTIFRYFSKSFKWKFLLPAFSLQIWKIWGVQLWRKNSIRSMVKSKNGNLLNDFTNVYAEKPSRIVMMLSWYGISRFIIWNSVATQYLFKMPLFIILRIGMDLFTSYDFFSKILGHYILL